MKKIILAALLAGVSSTAALAADLPSRKVAPAAPAYAAPMFTWSGLYVGLQAGYAWDKVSVGATSTVFGFLPAASVNNGGFVGGAHIGYNLQTGPAVFGVEGDVEGTTVRNSALRASVRGRLGFAVDRVLFYGTGGLALATSNYNTYYWNNGSNTRLGWTAGAGVEYAFAPNWSARLEYRYSDFGRTNANGWLAPSVRRTENAVRLGVSYHFGGPAAPVVAKY
ncbi:MAG: porin family protein [Hyphomicrobiales bacterium]|nr:porin family protein [Hyphomicrobiales bacterium]